MESREVSRRTLLKGGGAALAGMAALQVAGPAHAFPGQAGEQVLPWLDQPEESPEPPEALRNLLVWERLDSWRTPAGDFFVVNHYNEPDLRAQDWRLTIDGLVARRQTFTLADLKARPRRAVDFTLECSGNTGLPYFIGGIGNARWAGTPLAPLLRSARPREGGIEVVFWGADAGEVAIRDNGGILRSGRSGKVEEDAAGLLDLTITEQFARSMSLEDALSRDNLLCYEMNGAPLPREHGFPVRLIAPGWYGVANVKWLSGIEVRDSRYQGRFMARDYVSVREETRDGKTVWTFKSVGRARLKSAPAKVTRRGDRYAILGAAWGAPVARVEVRIDDGPWRRARLLRPPTRDRGARTFAWAFWRLPWDAPSSGDHAITTRAFDTDGNVQPTPDHPSVAGNITYWEHDERITRRVRIP